MTLLSDRAGLVDWYRTNRARSAAIFGSLTQSAYYAAPIPLRHPFVFYDGHLPAFSYIVLHRRALGGAPVDLGISFIAGGPGMPRPDPGGGSNDRDGIFVTPPADLVEGVEVDAEVSVIVHEPAALEAPRLAEPRRVPKPMSAAAEWEALGGEASDT